MSSPGQELKSPQNMAAQPFQSGSEDFSNMGDGAAQQQHPSSLNSIDNMPDTILSPNQSNLHPLPPRPVSQLSSQAATPSVAQSSSPVPAQNKPRIVGGFEVDDDDDAEDEVGEEDEDEADPYDPSGLDFDTPAPAPTNPFDRTSQSPEQENGITPAAVQVTGSPAELSPSALPTGTDAPRAATATPAQVTVDAPVQASPPLPHVNGSIAPAVPRSRLAHDVVGILEDRIKEDPRGDTQAYLELIDELKSRNKQDDVRRVYEQYLAVFPFAVRMIVCWSALANF
jgi:cleavage stimulation factor subunit 3